MNIIGCDIGTMFCVCAKRIQGGKAKISSMRNMFVPVDEDFSNLSSDLTGAGIDYIEYEDEISGAKSLFMIGEDAYRFANMFNHKVKRPMSKGVISSDEIDALDILTLMMERLIEGKVTEGYCVYSIPEAAIDLEIPPVLYHERVFNQIFTTLGYESKSLNEAMAIIYSQCKKEKYSGIACSFGAGLTNVACSYKGIPTLTFAISRAGDWIDTNVAASLNMVPNRITAIKEKPEFDLINPTSLDKKERRVQNAISFYYKSLIEYVLKIIINKFNQNAEGLSIGEDIPIIISGGTSKPKGFLELFKSVFERTKNFPYKISEIRQAEDPLTAVAEGCLLYATMEKEKDKKDEQGN